MNLVCWFPTSCACLRSKANMAVFQLPLPPATALHEPAEEQEVGSIHDYKVWVLLLS